MAKKDTDPIYKDFPEDVRKAIVIAQKVHAANKVRGPVEIRVQLSKPNRWQVISGDVVVYDSADPDNAELDLKTAKKAKTKIKRKRIGKFQMGKIISTFIDHIKKVWDKREETLNTIWERIYAPPKKKASTLTRIYFLGLLFLVSVPSYFVYQERWLENLSVLSNFHERWVATDWVNIYLFPSYFYGVLIAVIVLLGIQLLFVFRHPNTNDLILDRSKQNQEKKQKFDPAKIRGLLILTLVLLGLIFLQFYYEVKMGVAYALGLVGLAVSWYLMEYSSESIRSWWRENRSWFVPAVLLHAALVYFLAKLYSIGMFPWLALLYLLLAGWIAYPKIKQMPFVYWFFNAAVVLYTVNINAWNFAVVGDEFAFLRAGQRIAQEFNWFVDLGQHLFRGNYVYEAHPFISAFLQSIPMKIFGVTNFSWTITELYLSALSIFFYYGFFKFFLKGRYAAIATALLAGSQYIMAFGKVGYNNLQSFFVLSLVLWATAKAIDSRRYFYFVLIGLFQALCFYVFPGALYVFPMPFLLLLLYLPPIKRESIQQWGLMIFIFVLALFPMILQEGHWSALLEGTVYNTPSIVESQDVLDKHFKSNFVYALFSPLYIIRESHYTTVGYMDYISAAFVFLGFSVFLYNFWRNRFSVFMLLSFVFLLFTLGISHGYESPPNTRMFLLLPWFVLFAVYGLYWLEDHFVKFGISQVAIHWVLGALVVYIVGLNVYQANVIAKERSTGYNQPVTLLLGIFQELSNTANAPETDLLIVYDTQNTRYHGPTIVELLGLYPIGFEEDNLKMLNVSEMTEPLVSATLRQENALVVVDNLLPVEQIDIYNGILTDLGRVECPVMVKDQLRFTYWYPDGYDWLCDQELK